jgi:hypothetical protein
MRICYDYTSVKLCFLNGVDETDVDCYMRMETKSDCLC